MAIIRAKVNIILLEVNRLLLFVLCVVPTDEQRLLDKLLAGYNAASRPVYNASQQVTVKFEITLAPIQDMEWVDERLRWNSSEFNGLKTLRMPCEKLWLPDIVLYNNADDLTAEYMQAKAMVQHDGNVFWAPQAKFRRSCKIDITYFPFDDQICRMKFGSWTFDGFQVDMLNRSAKVDLSNYVYSGEWELIDLRVVRNIITYGCCEEFFPDVTFTIIVRPCLWLTILILLGFWLPPDSREKITLGITVLFAFSVFMLLIAENMPATSEFVPLIGIYLTVTMRMTSLAIILTVFVLQLHYVGPHQRCPKMAPVFLVRTTRSASVYASATQHILVSSFKVQLQG